MRKCHRFWGGEEYHPIRLIAGLEVKDYLTESDMSTVEWSTHPAVLGGVVEWEHQKAYRHTIFQLLLA